MIAAYYRFDPDTRKALATLRKEHPKAFRAAVINAMSTLRRNMSAVMEGRKATYIPALAPLHPLSTLLRADKKLGNRLAKSKTTRYQLFGMFGRVGWIPGLRDAAIAFQSGKTRPVSKQERHMLHWQLGKMGVKNHSVIPHLYVAPTRDVTDTLTLNTASEVPKWIARMVEKLLSRKQKFNVKKKR